MSALHLSFYPDGLEEMIGVKYLQKFYQICRLEMTVTATVFAIAKNLDQVLLACLSDLYFESGDDTRRAGQPEAEEIFGKEEVIVHDVEPGLCQKVTSIFFCEIFNKLL